MPPLRTLIPALAAAVLCLDPAEASWVVDEPGSRVGVSVEVEDRHAPLYGAPDGSGRFYLEAWPGARYSIRLANRTHERLAVLLTVDGLNVISGREEVPAGARRGRMYVLDPWDATVVRGWRSSLDEVRRFTFVDERASYAARSGKANARTGWIEVVVYRERRPVVRREAPPGGWVGGHDAEDRAGTPEESKRPAPASPGSDMGRAEGESRAYPGTGWGARTDDPAQVVSFEPEDRPIERVVLRYEYRPALRALGILPVPARPWRDRLSERDRGDGFAPPPPR